VKPWRLFAAAVVILCPTDAPLAGAVEPARYAERISITVQGRDRGYHSGTESSPVEFHVVGPATIRVLARIELGMRGTARPFTVYAGLDGGKPRAHSFRAGRSADAGFRDDPDQPLSRSCSFYVTVERGVHRCRVWGDAPRGKIWLRALSAERPKQSRSVAYWPKKWADVVTLIVREQEYKYYRATADQPVELEILGPTTIEVRSRFEFDFATKGIHDYRMQVLEDGALKRSYAFSSRRSHVCVYRDQLELVPGRANKFHLTVGRGRHVFTFVPQARPDPSLGVLLRFFVPRSALRP
jgi:hypothetical protein